MAVHERVWERGPDPRRATYMPPAVWHPKGTYAILAAMLGVFILQYVTIAFAGPGWHTYLWAITSYWYVQPWSLLTSTLAHGSITHILFNGLILFFFGPILERIIGTKRFVTLFFVAGAISGILQVSLQPGSALGASGAIMMVFGTLMLLMPKEKILVYGIVPVPFWAAGAAYIVWDLWGALFADDGIGHFAHLAGMALGVWLGMELKRRARQRSVAWVGT